MAINQLKIVISVLKEISEDNIPNANDYGIDEIKYCDILKAMQDEKLINGVVFRDELGRIVEAFPDNVKLTIKGMEYLNNNSALVKTYKGLKEIREWLPF